MSRRRWSEAVPFEGEKWHRYAQTAGPDMWDTDSAVTHAVEGRRTLCGTVVPGHARSDGRWEQAWGDALVTCGRCAASIERRQRCPR